MSEHANRVDPIAMTRLSTDGPPDISSQIEPYRRELHLHCYRLLGSLLDAEDLVQETMLRAWQRFDSFRGASSLRTWLYTIATNACLDALKKRLPRTLPQAAYPLADPHGPIPPPISDAIWLEPFPDMWLAEAPDTPEAHYTRRESVSLAFLTALQLLPPRQRAILILSDVLDWRAREIADLLELSVSAVNSALHRARATLAKNYHADEPGLIQVDRADAATSALLNRYVRAWETDDVAGLVALLKEDATFNMPPFPLWYWGREAIQTILSFAAFGAGRENQWRLFPTDANGLPAFALYRADTSKSFYRAFGVQVLTFDDSTPERQIADLTIFQTPALVTYFGFPLQRPG
jgi:RNA polymerase sigma-70 factor (ECF subfamily)